MPAKADIFSSPKSQRSTSIRRNSKNFALEEDEQEVAGIEVDRVSFMNTALRALPGNTLRTFLAPVMNVKCGLIKRRRLTEKYFSSDSSKLEKAFKEGIRILTKTLVDASLELFETPMPLDEKELAIYLKGKMIPICYEPGATLAYPGEFPETMFVHIVLSGSVQIVHYQPQSRKGAISDSSKRQYFVSNDLIRLGGSLGFQPELLKYITTTTEITSDATSDAASTSNVSTAIQRSLRRASRMIGQPTLLPTRTELFRAPYVCCATEALGMEPFRLATVTAEATAPSAKGGDSGQDSRVTVTMRIRTKDLHDALITMALNNSAKNVFSSNLGSTTRHLPTLSEYISASRVRAISRHYPLNEILMRQSWLLQDTPAHTIRVLVTQLTPRSFLPGDIILCPHTVSRQLCFLRRGTMTIEELPISNSKDTGSCQCNYFNNEGKVLQEVPVGASFGELSVLFGEPRHFILRARTTCDIWCLSHHGFAATVRRDDALRESLLSKAAALRMRWLGEQRFTTSLAKKLREICELFREAPDCFIRLIQERMEPVVSPPGTLLTTTSTRCGEMLIILHGKVSSIVDGVAEYGPGSVIGEPTIILHRWPLGLVSKTMVEGWKLSRHHLRDALRRVEILRQHSGEVGAHAPQLMQRLFAPPVPPCDVDAVGRSRMPLVGPPPRGETYLEYAQWLAEVQLKAICFRYRDFVKWEDIFYTTLPGERRARQAVRQEAISTGLMETTRDYNTRVVVAAAGTGTNAARQKKKMNVGEKQKKKKVAAGSTFSFYVNQNIIHQPFARPILRKLPPVLNEEEEDPFVVRQRALTAGLKTHPDTNLLPNLENLKTLLENRDKLQKVEAKQNVFTETQKERIDLVNLTADPSSTGALAPVHIFLQGQNPRVQITVEEAINIGYVLQFPDTKRIQSCVSNIDSDVTLGLPQHRQRRRDMALTPNDRHHRRCFLFAASQLGEKSAEQILVKETASREADTKEKAQHLTTLLISQISERRRRLNEKNVKSSEIVLERSTEWQRTPPKSFFRGPLSLSPRSSPAKEPNPSSSKEEEEKMLIRQLCENPEKTLNSIRAKYQVTQETGENETNETSFYRPSSEIGSNAPTGDLMERLRNASITSETATLDPSSGAVGNGLPPRRPSIFNDEKNINKTSDEGENPMETFLKQEDSPVFIDGYGQLGIPHNKSLAEVQGSQAPTEVFVQEDQYMWSSLTVPAGKESNSVSAWLPRNFVMPSVSEATATMRRIQRDVDGLNAVAEEKRLEKLQGRRRREDLSNELSNNTPLPTEYQRLIEEWTTTFRENARDPLFPARIPPQLVAESGTDYLAGEFQLTRHQHARVPSGKQGVETWRGEVDTKDRRDLKTRDGAGEKGGTSVLTVVGPRKFGLPSKPLTNPTSRMSKDEYQKWVEERDAMFAAASR